MQHNINVYIFDQINVIYFLIDGLSNWKYKHKEKTSIFVFVWIFYKINHNLNKSQF